MKKNLAKTLSMVFVLALAVFALVGCGGNDGDKDADAPATVLTEEEYNAKLAEFEQAAASLQTDMQTKAAELDPTDIEGAKALFEEMKKPFADFAAVEAPEKYAAAQAKFKSGCEAMIAYIDATVKMVEDPTSVDENTTKEIMDYVQTAMTDIAEGSTLKATADAE